MHYVDEGSGPTTALLLHGNPTWSFFYRELIPGLREGGRVLAPDHIGCGLSEKPRTYAYTLETHIRNLTEFVERLRLPAVDLVVHDWGGPIGFGWATRHPERVRRLVVLNSAAWLGERAPWRIRICRSSLIGNFAVRRLNLFTRAAVRMAVAKRRLPRAVREGYLAPYDSYAHRIAILRFVQDIPVDPTIPSHRVLQEIEANLPRLADKPMLICWGMRDFCFRPHFLDGWLERFPRAQVHRFADAGHYLLEDAHDEVVPLIRRFLSSSTP